MTLRIYNTATKELEDFVSSDQKVRIYTCGPTVYDYPHVGNWVAYIHWDTLVRTLLSHGYEVKRVMNITDVGHLTGDNEGDPNIGEDKLEKGARREGKTAWQVAEFYTQDFMAGMEKLGLILPEHIARATDFITEQLELVRILKDKGYTYQISDGIYFDTAKFPRYGDFARLNTDELKAGARVEFNPEKRNASDFALWKFSPKGEKRDMEWETPHDLLDNPPEPLGDKSEEASAAQAATDAGARSAAWREAASEDFVDKKANATPKMGFPGWHLECSAIAMTLLDETLDVHTGGIDHIPVHHTNEIAQSEAATGQTFSRYWLHNNHMKVDGSKISKSLGNGYTLQDIEKKGFSPLDFRLLVLQSQYQSEANFSFESLEAAKNRRHHWREIAALRWQLPEVEDDTFATTATQATEDILSALNDNLNTPEALRIIDESFTRLENAPLQALSRSSLNSLLETIDAMLGLQLVDSTPDIDDDAKELIKARDHARADKNWAESDRLRDELTTRGITLRDTAQGSVWTYA